MAEGESSRETDVVIIGAGPGGYAAAFRAADLGLKTILIDRRERPGGVCLYLGCIPSKALLHASEVVSQTQHAAHFGIHFSELKIDLKALGDWRYAVEEKLASGLSELCRQRGVKFIRGRAQFKSSESIRLEDSEVSSIHFKHAVVATGSRPMSLPGIDIESSKVMDSTAALDLQTVPETLLVVGGGYIGLELGTVYATLGSKVTVVEVLDGLLPGVDVDLVKPLEKRIRKLFENVYLNTRLTGMKEIKNGIQVNLQSGVEKERKLFDRVLVAVGREPNSGHLGLANTRVEVGSNGLIQVDSQRRTTDPRIFAVGDVAAQPMLAHKATREGKVAAEVIAGQSSEFDNQAIPAVVFTDPEVAWCGLTETDAKQQDRPVKITRFPWAASGRAMTLGRSEGLTKILFDSETGRVLGVGIVGPHAGELIAEGVLAVEMAAVAEDLSSTIHAHPTLAETMGEAAEAFLGQATHVYRK